MLDERKGCAPGTFPMAMGMLPVWENPKIADFEFAWGVRRRVFQA